MPVNLFDEILLWPVRLVGSPEFTEGREPRVDREATLDRWTEILTSGSSKWRAADVHKGELSDNEYAERVYFHPFVRQFLYGGERRRPPLRRLTRHDVGRVRIQFGTSSIELDVRRVELLLDIRVAILAVEIISRGTLTLDEALLIRDQFRRVYPPFWMDSLPGLCPDRVEWLDKNGKLIPGASASDFDHKTEYLKCVREHNEPRVAAHWGWMMSPLTADAGERTENTIRYRHVVDERIPEMGYLALSYPAGISRADWVRLAFLDSPGTGMPYSSEFLRDFEAKYCYDRFWSPMPPEGPMLTRFLNCGYGFTMISSGEPAYLHSHFRNHYFQMGLIAYFQKAWLLVLEQELFETVAALNEGDSDQFRTRIEAVHQEIAEFTTRYWFTEVSSQVQPQELFEWWLDRLGTPKLYGQLLEEVRSVDHVLNAVRDRRRNREMSILTWVGTVGLALGLGINFLGMNVISRDLD